MIQSLLASNLDLIFRLSKKKSLKIRNLQKQNKINIK